MNPLISTHHSHSFTYIADRVTFILRLWLVNLSVQNDFFKIITHISETGEDNKLGVKMKSSLYKELRLVKKKHRTKYLQ